MGGKAEFSFRSAPRRVFEKLLWSTFEALVKTVPLGGGGGCPGKSGVSTPPPPPASESPPSLGLGWHSAESRGGSRWFQSPGASTAQWDLSASPV